MGARTALPRGLDGEARRRVALFFPLAARAGSGSRSASSSSRGDVSDAAPSPLSSLSRPARLRGDARGVTSLGARMALRALGVPSGNAAAWSSLSKAVIDFRALVLASSWIRFVDVALGDGGGESGQMSALRRRCVWIGTPSGGGLSGRSGGALS